MPPRASQIERRTNPPPAVSTHVMRATHFIAIELLSVDGGPKPRMLSLQTRSDARVGSVARVERLDGVGSPELRATLRFVRAHPRPVTAGELAAALSVARSVARWRLERLCQAGLLVPAFERRSGRAGPGGGRPAKAYAVAAESEAIEFPPRRYEELLRLLVAALPRRA